MPDDHESRISEAIQVQSTAHNKYVYFLLAVAASCMALAAQQTKDLTISHSEWPLGIAVGLWLFSFFAGCMNRERDNGVLLGRIWLLQVTQDLRPGEGGRLDKEQAYQEIEEFERKQEKWGHYQFYSLVAGALFYLGWHVTKMFDRTFNS